ncbi:Hypothetical predicted protein [Paramuricea clavata]|uniref:Uncharacterized protein n=1 Tax=Paramuricea clavata TaxID=317549 RepID=A0A6S7JUQ1_PARCT|nr:Hypothetical predicted protein [Paramuricea clavata]
MASDRFARTLSEAIGRAIHETLRTEDAEQPSQRQRDGQEQQLQQSQRPARGQLANDTQPSRQTTLVTVGNSGISRQVATTSNSRQSNLICKFLSQLMSEIFMT